MEDNLKEYSFEDIENLSQQLKNHSRRYSNAFTEEDEAMLK